MFRKKIIEKDEISFDQMAWLKKSQHAFLHTVAQPLLETLLVLSAELKNTLEDKITIIITTD